MDSAPAETTVDRAPGLAPYAADPAHSRGRRAPETSAAPRSEYQRDRDRIVHCTAFRRLVYKTQVFLNHEGDHFRTRLTHSLEVAQLSRAMARRLRLNEDLVEAIALAHDLGHTPFGHAGQDALADCMRAHGGFEHNLQSLRVIDHLEQRYAAFDGLNLCFETREGVLKHCSRQAAAELEAAEPGGVARRFAEGTLPSLEAQLVNLADEMAYGVHDIDDGLRSGLIGIEQVCSLPLFAQQRQRALDEHPTLAERPRRWLAETLRRLLAVLVDDLVQHTVQQLGRVPTLDREGVRRGVVQVAHSPAIESECVALKRFLFAALYRHPRVVENTDKGRTVVRELFQHYVQRPDEMSPELAAAASGASGLHRAVADYVAGMTDRFALREHQRLTGRLMFAL